MNCNNPGNAAQCFLSPLFSVPSGHSSVQHNFAGVNFEVDVSAVELSTVTKAGTSGFADPAIMLDHPGAVDSICVLFATFFAHCTWPYGSSGIYLSGNYEKQTTCHKQTPSILQDDAQAQVCQTNGVNDGCLSSGRHVLSVILSLIHI